MYLIHHGRKNQKWGIMNGPPYPLDQTNKEYKQNQANNEKEDDIKYRPNRYRDEHGRLTDEGKKRYAKELKDNARKKKDNQVKDLDALNDPDEWVRKDIENARDVVNASSDIVREMKKIEQMSSIKKRTMGDYSNISDQELRNRINRIQMERQYNDLINPQTTSKGRVIAQNILEYGGAALAMTASGLGIALSVKKLRGS